MTWTILNRLDSEAKKRWDEWLTQHGGVFHMTGFAEQTDTIGYEPHFALWSETADSSEGQSVIFKKRVGPSPMGLSWAVFFAEPTYSNSISSAEKTERLSTLLTQLGTWRPAYVGTMASMTRFESEIPKKAARVPFGTFEIDLTLTEDSLWAGLHSKHRNSVRAAQKASITVQESTDINDFYRLLVETLKRAHEAAPPKDYIVRVSQALAKTGNARLFSAVRDEQTHASALILLTTHKAYYWFGATAAFAETGAGNLLQWEIIRTLRDDHVKVYDLGGARPNVPETSKLYGINRFKERFGGHFRDYPQWKLTYSYPRTKMLEQLQKVKRLVKR